MELGADDFLDITQNDWGTAFSAADLVVDNVGGEVLAKSAKHIPGKVVLTP